MSAGDEATVARTEASGRSATGGGRVTISLEGVRKVYGAEHDGTVALSDVDLVVEQGQFVSILGPSGCGKSTLLNIIAGLLPASRGRVTVLGERVTGPVTASGVVFQQDLLLPWRSVLRNVMLQIESRHLPLGDYETRARELLALVGLDGFEHALPRELSGGMRQRVSMCRALVHNPPLLLMDEPFGALDAMTRDQMNLDIERIWRRERKTIVFVTHSIAEAVFLSDRVVVMSPRPGRIVTDLPIDLGRPRGLALRDTPEYTELLRRVRRCFEDMGLLREEGPGEIG